MCELFYFNSFHKNIIYYNNYFYFYGNKKNMMTKFSVLTVSAFTLFLVSCKPAAEDRVKMHENAKRVSDSIAKTIDIPLNEVKPQAPSSVVVDTTKK